MGIRMTPGGCFAARIPGTAIANEKRRGGALGKLDSISFRQFREKPLDEQLALVREARKEQIGAMFAASDAECVNRAKELGLAGEEFAKICREHPNHHTVYALDDPDFHYPDTARILADAKSIYCLEAEDLVAKNTILTAFRNDIRFVDNNGGGWSYIRHWDTKYLFSVELPDFSSWDGRIRRDDTGKKARICAIEVPVEMLGKLKEKGRIHVDRYQITIHNGTLDIRYEGYFGYKYVQRMVDKGLIIEKEFAAVAKEVCLGLAKDALGYELDMRSADTKWDRFMIAWSFHMRRMFADAAVTLVKQWKLEVDEEIYGRLTAIVNREV